MESPVGVMVSSMSGHLCSPQTTARSLSVTSSTSGHLRSSTVQQIVGSVTSVMSGHLRTPFVAIRVGVASLAIVASGRSSIVPDAVKLLISSTTGILETSVKGLYVATLQRFHHWRIGNDAHKNETIVRKVNN